MALCIIFSSGGKTVAEKGLSRDKKNKKGRVNSFFQKKFLWARDGIAAGMETGKGRRTVQRFLRADIGLFRGCVIENG